jgi:hypothetical protein
MKLILKTLMGLTKCITVLKNKDKCKRLTTNRQQICKLNNLDPEHRYFNLVKTSGSIKSR